MGRDPVEVWERQLEGRILINEVVSTPREIHQTPVCLIRNRQPCVSRFGQLTGLPLRVLRGLADVLGQSPDEAGQLRHAPEERLVVVASLIYRIDAVSVEGGWFSTRNFKASNASQRRAHLVPTRRGA